MLEPLDRRNRRKRGIAMVWMAVAMAPLLGLTGLAVDMGNVALTRSKLQSYADAKAISALKERFGGLPRQVMLEDYVGKAGVGLTKDAHVGVFRFNLGTFLETQALSLGTGEVPARSVLVDDFELPLFFGPIVGVPKVKLSAEAVAYLGRRQVVIVQDVSGSMSAGSRMANAKQADKRVIQDMVNQKIAGDQVGLVAFDDGIVTKQGLTPLATQSGTLLGIVDGWSPLGGTNIAIGIKEGASLFPEPHDADVERIMIVVGDGLDCTYSESKKQADAAGARDIHLFTIMITDGTAGGGFGGCDDNGGPESYFSGLVQNRGVYKPSPNGNDLDSLLVSIVAGIPLRLVQ